MAESHVIYVPASATCHGVIAGSAIVASLEAAAQGLLIAYLEGNAYGAANLRDFPSRVLSAAGRQVARYPTTAMMGFPQGHLVEVGRYDYEAQAITQVSNVEHLRRWLEEETALVDAMVAAQESGRPPHQRPRRLSTAEVMQKHFADLARVHAAIAGCAAGDLVLPGTEDDTEAA